MNSNFDDIIEMLTDSLSRDNEGGMQAVLELDNDGFVYATDPNTGMRRTAGDEQAIECGGVDIVEFTSTGATVNGDLEVTGALTVAGVALLPIGLGPLPWSGLTAPANWIFARGQSLVRATYPDLWTFAAVQIAGGNTLYTNGNGTTTFTVPDLSGGTTFGFDNSTSRLTTANSGVDGATLGAVGGIPNPTILTANLPAYTPAGSVSTSASIGANGTALSVFSGGGSVGFGAGANANGNLFGAGGNTLSSSFTGTAQGGVSTPVKTQPRTVVTNYIIYAGA